MPANIRSPVLSPYLLPKNMKIELYRTILYPLSFMGTEIGLWY